MAMLETKKVKRTACCLLVDKEEIGSVGATGMRSRFFENALAEVLDLMERPGELTLRRVLANSRMLSSDVSSGFDALYASAFDKKNVAYLGKGSSLTNSPAPGENPAPMMPMLNISDRFAISWTKTRFASSCRSSAG